MVKCSTAGSFKIMHSTYTLVSLTVSGTAVTTAALTTWKPSSIPDYLTDLTGT